MKKTKIVLAALLCLFTTAALMSTNLYAKARAELGITLNVSIPSKTPGSTANIQANVTGGSSNYEYKYSWSVNGSAKTAINSPISEKRVSLLIEKTGTYEIFAEIKDKKTGEVANASRKFKITPEWDVALSLSAPSTSPGTKISAKANARGKDDTYKYKFVLSINNWQDYKVLSPFSDKNSIVCNPSLEGKYDLYVDVMDKFGNVQTTYKTFNIKKGWKSNLKVDVKSSKVGANQKGLIIADGKASGNASNVKYKFVWSKNNWEDWGVISDLSTKSKISWSPVRTGRYDIYVDAVDKFGNVETRSQSFTLSTDWSTSQPSLSMKTLMPGESMKISANTYGEVHGARYKFVYSYNNWKEWGVISNFSGKGSVNFTPKKSGTYDIYVDVRDSRGNINSSSKRIVISGKLKLMVNLRTQVVSAVAQDSNGNYTQVVRNMICSTGKIAGDTPSGTFKMQTQYRWHPLMGGVWGQWCSRITGSILFHSVPYRAPSPSTLVTKYYNNLGSPASAGCVRLRAVDAKWIYDNCSPGTVVQIGNFYDSFLPGKMTTRKLKSSTNWDPSDPTSGNPFYGKGYL